MRGLVQETFMVVKIKDKQYDTYYYNNEGVRITHGRSFFNVDNEIRLFRCHRFFFNSKAEGELIIDQRPILN